MICCCRPPPPINNNTHTSPCPIPREAFRMNSKKFPFRCTIRKDLSKTKIRLQSLCHKSLHYVTNLITSQNRGISCDPESNRPQPGKITAKEASMKAHRARQKLASAENHEIETTCTAEKETSGNELLNNRR